MFDEIRPQLEIFAEDAAIDITDAQMRKITNIAVNLLKDTDISLDEIVEDFQGTFPKHAEEWDEFIQEASNYIFELIQEQTDESEDEELEE